MKSYYEEKWWSVKVYDEVSHTTTNFIKFGTLYSVREELEKSSLLILLSIKPRK